MKVELLATLKQRGEVIEKHWVCPPVLSDLFPNLLIDCARKPDGRVELLAVYVGDDVVFAREI